MCFIFQIGRKKLPLMRSLLFVSLKNAGKETLRKISGERKDFVRANVVMLILLAFAIKTLK